MSATDMRRCLEECDVRGARALWAKLSPHLPQPESDEQALVVLHHARTQAGSIAFRHRAYSHAWLSERGLPSGLPDRLKPRAERLYSRIVSAIGIAVKATAEWRKPAAAIIQRAMSDAVEDAYAEGRTDPEFVRARMGEARRRAARGL